MSYKVIRLDISEKVAKVTLNRPGKRNAMSPDLTLEIVRLLDELRYRKDINVLVITGAGDSFCAGMDLEEFFAKLKMQDPEQFQRIYEIATEWRGRTLYHYPKVTIAMVNGWCFGGGLPIVEGCDLAVAADEAVFGLSEINFGLFPGGTVSKSISRVLRPKDAMYYALTGETFDGRRAAQIGFVNFSVPRAQLEEKTMELAAKLAAKDPAALRATKEGQRHSLEMPWDSAINYAFAKEQEVTLAQDGQWVKTNIPDFIKGQYKPGLEGHEAIK